MHTQLDAALKILLGDKPDGYYIAGFIFSFIAIFLSLYAHSRKRNKYSSATPVNYSWRFLFWDNAKRIVAGLLVMFIIFRAFNMSTIWHMLAVGFGVAFSLDKIIQVIMERSNLLDFLKANRDNMPGKK